MERDENFLLDYMPKVVTYKNKFDSLNGLLNKTTLTGKISSLDIAENLFIFMDETQQKFSELQTNLINTLLEENFKKVITEISTISQVFADVINRSFYERIANTQALRQDEDILNFLQNHGTGAETIATRLQSFMTRYPMYDDIMLFDKNGTMLTSAKKNKPKTQTVDTVLEAIQKDTIIDRIQTYGDLDDSITVLYAASVVRKFGKEGQECLGGIALGFDLKKELEHTFQVLRGGNSQHAMLLLNSKSMVVATSNPHDFPLLSKVSITKHESHQSTQVRNREYLVATSEPHGYMGYTMDWKACVMISFRNAFSHSQKSQAQLDSLKASSSEKDEAIELGSGELEISEEQLDDSSLMGDELRQIIVEAENITEDLGDVVINGEIIASKSHSYSLNPILDNIRILSDQINSVCIESIKDLQDTVLNATVDTSSFFALLSAEVIDRNLYERSNDVRWLAKNSMLRQQMSVPNLTPGNKSLFSLLEHLVKLYPVYSSMFLFDAEGQVIAVSSNSLSDQLETKIDSTIVMKVKNTSRGNKYIVSDFAKSPFYKNQETYIFYSAITKDDESLNPLGGIGLVLDAKTQFPAMINDALPKGRHGEVKANTFGVFTEKGGRIIASTHKDIKVGEILEVDEKYFKLDLKDELSEVEDFRGQPHIIGCRRSQGYREFKKTDGYVNDIYSFMLMEL